MKYVALATDYDGTLAHDGRVDQATIAALERFRQSGRKLILVTGRLLADLASIFSRLDLFDCVVAENGAVVYHPAMREKRTLVSPPEPAFLKRPIDHRVEPLVVGDVIVATNTPNETIVVEVIRDLGLELQVIFNKGAVMVLPSGINKKSGLCSALEVMQISEHNVVGVGDAENDHAFLQYCECSVAVANALPAFKETADVTTKADHGAGVVELIELILAGELDRHLIPRCSIPIGRDGANEICVPADGASLLVTGASGSGVHVCGGSSGDPDRAPLPGLPGRSRGRL